MTTEILPSIRAHSLANPLPLFTIPKVSYLLTVGNDAKTVLGEELGFLTGIQYLAPSTVSGIVNLCLKASAGCKLACLNFSGRGIFTTTQQARINRTILFVRFKPQFWAQLIKNIKSLIRKAKKLGFIPVIRLNGTSDNLWERMTIKGTEFDGLTIFQAFPEVQFYDYTKYTFQERSTNLPNNYHLTYSFSEDTTPEILADNLNNGRNVAVVFNICKLGNKGKCHNKCKCPLPETWNGYKVISGNDSDVRFMDPIGVIVGLRANGKARDDDSGFVQKA